MVKDLAPAKLSQGANALIGLSQSSGGIVGPVIAGLLISVASPGYSFVLDAVSFVISSVLLIKLSVPATTPRAASPNFWRDLAGGASLVLDRSWFLVNIVGHGLWNLGIAVFFVVGPVVCEERLGGARAWGIISAAVSVGFVLGGVVVLRIRPKRLLVVGNLALVLTAVPMLVLTTTRLPVIVVLTAVAFTGPAVLNGLWATAVRSIYPTEVLGRVLSYDMLVSSVMMPVGFAVSGPVSEHYGPRAALVGAALVIAVPSLAVAGLGSVRRIVRQPDGTIADIGAPSRASAGGQLDPRPEDGQRSAADPPVDVPPGHSVTPDSAR
jgi:MFS family permease